MTTAKSEIRDADDPLPSSFLETRTLDARGEVIVRTDVRPNGFSYGQNLVMQTSQLRHMVEHHPIRMAEQTLTFDISFPSLLQRVTLNNRIRAHHQYSIAVTTPAPMILFLTPVFRAFRGFIEEVEDGDERFLAAYRAQYTMKLITETTQETTGFEGADQPFLPTAQTVADYGSDWLDFTPRQNFEEDYHIPGSSTRLR